MEVVAVVVVPALDQLVRKFGGKRARPGVQRQPTVVGTLRRGSQEKPRLPTLQRAATAERRELRDQDKTCRSSLKQLPLHHLRAGTALAAAPAAPAVYAAPSRPCGAAAIDF